MGIGAVKYADLSVAHDSEYVFDFDRMLALHRQHRPLPAVRRRADPLDLPQGRQPRPGRGAGRRAGSILARAGRARPGPGPAGVRLRGGRRSATASSRTGCAAYLFDLAQAFTAFYEQCPILQAADPEVRASRLALSATTLAVMVRGLDLLGILAPEEM